MIRLVLGMLVLMHAIVASAHEVRPSYLALNELTPGKFSVLWKTPMRGDMRLALTPEFRIATRVVDPVGYSVGDASIQRWTLQALEPLRGAELRITGLEATMTDALVRVTFADGTTWATRLTPQIPSARVPIEATPLDIAALYTQLGIEHILLGIDHLLFVLALLLITFGKWRLVKTITAFTIAHSITLALATLGVVHVPAAPVEAVIALSIVFVAAEIVHLHYGRIGLIARSPWIVAFGFGLLHGFGFAGALAEVGLPERDIPVALLFFNVGVEIGQLLFVAAVLVAMSAARRFVHQAQPWIRPAAAYGIGSIAMFWVIQRVAAF